MGCRGSGSTRYSGDLEARAAGNSALEGYGHQYWPIRSRILACRTPLSDREAWRATVHRVTVSRTLPKRPCVHRHKTSFARGSSVPVRVEREGSAAAWLVGALAAQVCRDTDCLHCRSYGPIRIFLQASCSCRSEGLFGQSFSVAPPLQALRGLPCLGSFSGDR